MEKENIFTGRTSTDAIEAGLKALGITLDQAEIEIIKEGRKKFFGYENAEVKITPIQTSNGERAVKFLEGLFNIMGVTATASFKEEGEKIDIEIDTTSHAVIGRRGEVLDSLQYMAGAVANIGNEEYKRVTVDCQNYRAQREKTLTDLANKLAKKANDTGRKVKLEPMNPYERRIIHAALLNSETVKTTSEGKEPNRYVVIIPNNLKPYEKKEGYKGKGRGGNRGERREGGKREGRGDRRQGGNNNRQARPSAPRGKKAINLTGSFLGNSGNKYEEKVETPTEE